MDADIGIARVLREVGRPRIDRATRGIHIAVEDIGELREAALAGVSIPDEAIHREVAGHEVADLKRRRAHEHDHDVSALGLRCGNRATLVLGERQIVRRAIRVGIVLLVLALLAGAGDEDDTRGILVLFYPVIDRRIVLIDAAVAAESRPRLAGSQRPWRLFERFGLSCRLHCIDSRIVDREGRKALFRRHRILHPLGRAARCILSIDRIQVRIAERHDDRALCKRKRSVVLQEDRSFILHLRCYLVGIFLGLICVDAICIVVVGIPVLGVICLLDACCARSEIGIERRGHDLACRRRDDGKDADKRYRDNQECPELPVAHPETSPLSLFPLLHCSPLPVCQHAHTGLPGPFSCQLCYAERYLREGMDQPIWQNLSLLWENREPSGMLGLQEETAVYRILIVEDDSRAAARLETLLERYGEEHKDPFRISRLESAFDISEEAAAADLIFLDIELPQIGGMDAAKALRAEGLDVPIIFVTNLAQYAVEGYAVSALDFIVKPVDYAALTLRMDRAVKAMEARSEHTICIQAKQGLHAVQARDLILVETRGHDIAYCLADGSELLARKALREAASELPSPPFLQISSGCIINMAHATGMEGSKIELSDGRAVYMSRGHKKSCLQALAHYLGGCL